MYTHVGIAYYIIYTHYVGITYYIMYTRVGIAYYIMHTHHVGIVYCFSLDLIMTDPLL